MLPTCPIHPQTLWSRSKVSPRRQPELMSRKNINFHKKSLKSQFWGQAPIPGQNAPKPQFQKCSDEVTLVSAGETSSDTTNDYQNLPNYAWSNSRVNGGVWGDVHALFCRPPTPISFGNSRKSALPRTYENQGTPSLSLALECKCAFGAKNSVSMWVTEL